MKRPLLAIVLLAVMTPCLAATVLHVTPDSSLIDAIRRARELRRTGQAAEVTIRLAAGTYHLYEP